MDRAGTGGAPLDRPSGVGVVTVFLDREDKEEVALLFIVSEGGTGTVLVA